MYKLFHWKSAAEETPPEKDVLCIGYMGAYFIGSFAYRSFKSHKAYMQTSTGALRSCKYWAYRPEKPETLKEE